ncbi:MAG: hypothetical protein RIB98_14540 [Acidimicrobiales bacterium]
MSDTATAATATADTLLIDLGAARELAVLLSAAAEEIVADQIALRDHLDRASALLHTDRTGALVPLASARRGFEDLAGDLRGRLDQIDRTHHGFGVLDHLSTQLDAWQGSPRAEGREALLAEMREVILRLVDGDEDHARRVERAIRGGLTAAAAFEFVAAELAFDQRVAAVMSGFGLDETSAREMIERFDANLVDLRARGFGDDESLAALTIVENFELDLGVILHHAAQTDTGLLDTVGQGLAARGLGVTLTEFEALAGLEEHFSVFDNATGGARDERVSVGDLEFVVEHPWLFAPSQVVAAQALLDLPGLRHRLDTAEANTDLFAAGGFGSTEPGDGMIAEVDLRAFMLKAQLHTILGDYADEIDIAADASGVVDGYRSENDFRAFVADNPDLPEEVVAAAEVALEAGWFDESWFQEHKDELAMAAALLASGAVIVATGGAGSFVLVVGSGMLAAGGTTIAINLATGEPMLDDLLANTAKGAFIGAGIHAAAAGAAASLTATTGLGRVAAIAGVTGGSADVIATGGFDLIIPEEDEGAVHDLAEQIGTVAGGIEAAEGMGEWATRHMARFDSVEEQLAALTDRVSRQRQARHVQGSPNQIDGGYFDDAADAQRVLDAVHDRSADVLCITRNQDLLVRYDGVTGIHRSMPESGLEIAETNMFLIKGTSIPSVVPTRPWRTR